MPSDAIVLKPDGSKTLWRLKQEGQTRTVESLTVETGLSFDGKKEVMSNRLKPGDQVVTRGNETLEPNAPVRVVKPIPPIHDKSDGNRPAGKGKSDRSNTNLSD